MFLKIDFCGSYILPKDNYFENYEKHIEYFNHLVVGKKVNPGNYCGTTFAAILFKQEDSCLVTRYDLLKFW